MFDLKVGDSQVLDPALGLSYTQSLKRLGSAFLPIFAMRRLANGQSENRARLVQEHQVEVVNLQTDL